ncbi:hypothetical protein GUITHDRAFT_100965 [Guillardia theta CCMP2712]|uniref:Uncharacterized protein n=1 Tax=Guillardia theta (strain CCMP2712) TaxID=905079 RepID=L1JYV1_GUITC|nr:hypothetical protein GUITHDRAFT_100965 [Guillardia theta CCMP2712]EKX53258.1 hypothetical protein GUITHDRAFT_100965 [Guillardia theta CCMP2712]|eukprot:XP_005840238.1 hypothetical protein GUITHDRAFT_100965 [Guillardia theta CCMP2712]
MASDVDGTDGSGSVVSSVSNFTTLEEEMRSSLIDRCFRQAKEGDLAGFKATSLTLVLCNGGRSEVNSIKDARGRTLLHWAAHEGHLSFVKFLLIDLLANVYETDQDGNTAADLAREQYWKKVLRFIESFADAQLRYVALLQSSCRRRLQRAEFVRWHGAACRVKCRVVALPFRRRKHETLRFTSMWFLNGEEGRKLLVSPLQARIRRLLLYQHAAAPEPSGCRYPLYHLAKHAALVVSSCVKRRLKSMLYKSAIVWCRKTGQPLGSMLNRLIGRYQSSSKQVVSPLIRNRSYIVHSSKFQLQLEQGGSSREAQLQVKRQFFEQKAREAERRRRSSVRVQRWFRRLQDRWRVEERLWGKEENRRVEEAFFKNKLFKLFTNQERSLLVYVEWGEEGERGGLRGLIFLHMKATEVMKEEEEARRSQRLLAQLEFEQLVERRRAAERRRKEEEAAGRIQKAWRGWRRRKLKHEELVRLSNTGWILRKKQEEEERKKELARLKIMMYSMRGDAEQRRRHKEQLENAISESMSRRREIAEEVQRTERGPSCRLPLFLPPD